MPTVYFRPTVFYNANPSTITVENQARALDGSSMTYATAKSSQSGTRNEYVYLRDFRAEEVGQLLSDIPNDLMINNVSIFLTISAVNQNTGASYAPSLCNGTSSYGIRSDPVSTTTRDLSFPITVSDLETFKAAGSDFGIRINCRRASSGSQSSTYIYTAVLIVDYSLPSVTVTSNLLSGEGIISPEGQTSISPGSEYMLTITPTWNTDIVTVEENGECRRELVVAQTQRSFLAYDYNRMDGIWDPLNYCQLCLGRSAEEGLQIITEYDTDIRLSDTLSIMMGFPAPVEYYFDFKQIPANAFITGTKIEVCGRKHNSNPSSAGCYLIYNNGDETPSTLANSSFTEINNSIITLTVDHTTSPLRGNNYASNLKFRFVVSGYGGIITGITWTVDYYVPNGINDKYEYTYTINGNTTINVNIEPNKVLYFKKNGMWTMSREAYIKSSTGWKEISDLTTAFSPENKIYLWK